MKWDKDWNPDRRKPKIFTDKENEEIGRNLRKDSKNHEYENLMIILKEIRDMLAVIVNQRKGRM